MGAGSRGDPEYEETGRRRDGAGEAANCRACRRRVVAVPYFAGFPKISTSITPALGRWTSEKWRAPYTVATTHTPPNATSVRQSRRLISLGTWFSATNVMSSKNNHMLGVAPLLLRLAAFAVFLSHRRRHHHSRVVYHSRDFDVHRNGKEHLVPLVAYLVPYSGELAVHCIAETKNV